MMIVLREVGGATTADSVLVSYFSAIDNVTGGEKLTDITFDSWTGVGATASNSKWTKARVVGAGSYTFVQGS